MGNGIIYVYIWETVFRSLRLYTQTERLTIKLTACLTTVILREGRHADAHAGLLGDRMHGVGAVHVGEGQAEVLLHGAQPQVFGVEVNQRAQQGVRTLLAELPAAPQTLLLHPAPQRA